MDRNVTLAVFLLFLIVADVSNAEFRKLAAADPKNDSSIAPGSDTNKPVEVQKPKDAQQALNNSSQQSTKTDLGSPAGPPVQNQTTDSEKAQKSSNNSVNGNNLESSNGTNPTLSPPDKGKFQKAPNAVESAGPTQVKESDNGKKNGTEQVRNDNNGKNNVTKEVNNGDNGKNNGTKGMKNKDKSSSALAVNETCRGLPQWCRDNDGELIACIQSFDTGSRELTVLVQNKGEKTLRVDLTVPTAVQLPFNPLEISKNQTRKINIPLSDGHIPKVIFNAGNGECVLHLDNHESEEKVFMYLPSYEKLVTPINGAYFLILTVLIFGGTWACCKFRKRRRHDGVPYQELEMGLPESVSATNVETAEGWDEGWDDDWDDNNAVKSPGPPHMGNISANGLTSRSLNRDGWEHDWDD